jgi:hypothetical protein
MAGGTEARPEGWGAWLWRAALLTLVVGTALLKLAYLAWGCRLDLAPDEAHYWDWSRRLDWSYYSKGPLVAYLIRAGRELAADLSCRLVASEALAVRLPAVVCGSLLLVSLYVLTVQVYRSRRLGVAVVAAALTVPVVTAGSLLMTIDAPFTCCWGWALVLGHRAIFRRSAWAWPALGLVVGLGILAKYTMLLWVASAGLFLLACPRQRVLLGRPGFWVMAVVAAACCLPIVWWNAQHDWVSLRHVGGQAGVRAPDGFRWLGPLSYVGAQAALLLGFWFVAWAAALIAHRPGRETDDGVLYLWWMSIPTFALFLIFSVKTDVEPNWPVTAYLSGLVLAAGWLARQLGAAQVWRRRLVGVGLLATVGVGLLLNTVALRSEWGWPLLLRLGARPTAERPFPLRRFDPTCRLRGWRHLAGEVDRVAAGLREEGIEPVLAATSWAVPGQLGCYCAGNPTVYSLGLAVGDRHSQYDIWRPNPLADPERFARRTFILVGPAGELVREAFEVVEPPQRVVYAERGQPIAAWGITVCRGYRGFPQRDGQKRAY